MGEKQVLVPRLRFPEFREAGEWKFIPLKKLAKRCTEKNQEGKLVRVLTNSAEHGVVDQRDYFDKDIAVQGNLEGYFIVKKGDFVYNPRISSKAPVGPISKNNVAIGVMSPLYTVFRFTIESDDFYAHYFKTTGWHQYMRQISSTGARHDRMAISKDDFISMPLPTSPVVKEQQKIAYCLSSLDALITAQAGKIDALKTHKKGLMQQLFPKVAGASSSRGFETGEQDAPATLVPKLRFPEFRDAGEWEVKELSNVCQINPSAKALPETFVYIDLESVEEGQLLQKRTISRTGAPSRAQRLLTRGDLIFQMVRPYQKNNYLLMPHDDLDYVASTGYAQLRAHGSHKFLFQYLHHDKFVGRVLVKCTGSNYPAINSSDLSTILVEIPRLPEQQKIADCLSSLDELIAAHLEKLDALKTHKKGLMQQLFPSPKDMCV